MRASSTEATVDFSGRIKPKKTTFFAALVFEWSMMIPKKLAHFLARRILDILMFPFSPFLFHCNVCISSFF